MIRRGIHYPLTLPGTAAVLTVLFFFGKGYSDSDYQGIFISAVFFLVFLLLAAAGYFFAGKSSLSDVSIKSIGDISSSSRDKNVQKIIFGERPPVFFRYSSVLKGRFCVTGKSFPWFSRFNSDRNGLIEYSFNFSSPGLLELGTEYFIEDVFGIFRIPCAERETNSVRIVPGLPDNASVDTKDSLSSFVKNKKPDDNDYEKILMREYMRGDRSRDINWKASSKSNTLYTRIAPGNDTEIKKINIVYVSDPDLFKDSIYSSFLIYRCFREYFRFFIHSLNSMESYKFSVYVNGMRINAEDRHGLDTAYRELSMPEIDNNFEKSLQDEEGAFVVFCENPGNIEDVKSCFTNASAVRYFYPVIVRGSDPGKTEKSGYSIKSSFESPGESVFTGVRFFREMRAFNRAKSSPGNVVADADARIVEIII